MKQIIPADLSALLRQGLSRSLASLVIKVAAAGLTYAMFVVMSRAMAPEAYGYFAFGLSLATILAIAASMGQQTAILRFWPEDLVAGRPAEAETALRSGAALTLLASLALTLALVLVAAVVGATGNGPVLHLYAAAALILPLALAEYWSSALRAQGSVWTALLPRDVIWRVAVPLAVVGLVQLAIPLSDWGALLLTAALLAAALGLQALFARMRGALLAPAFKGLKRYWQRRGGASRWFLAGTVIDSAALNVDIILVGLFVTPALAGIYFNAFRTAGLLTLFMFAITLVVAPMVSRHYHAGEMRKAQAITALCAWAGFVFSLGVFAGFVLFGDAILSLFGNTDPAGTTVLLLLSVGLLFDAATGPSRIVMMMTGHERDYVRIFGSIMVAGFVLQLALVPVFGVVAAAVVNMAARIVAQLAIAAWSRRHIGIDTSLLGAFLVTRMRDRPQPAPAL